jgi:hypothetical protein
VGRLPLLLSAIFSALVEERRCSWRVDKLPGELLRHSPFVTCPHDGFATRKQTYPIYLRLS